MPPKYKFRVTTARAAHKFKKRGPTASAQRSSMRRAIEESLRIAGPDVSLPCDSPSVRTEASTSSISEDSNVGSQPPSSPSFSSQPSTPSSLTSFSGPFTPASSISSAASSPASQAPSTPLQTSQRRQSTALLTFQAPSTPLQASQRRQPITPSTSSSTDDSEAGDNHSNGVPALRKGWYQVREIVSEARRAGKLTYLVEWEGVNPKTGVMWPASWINAKNVSASAVQAWGETKEAMKA
ncbi:Uu.00g078180.m01.CDS01 [Anthostomella pinea]|uniref:Uu.00g078180.m01.CDS01 n=1 Tax=Anthostomella pinea TaxID=933095 RepID=A0AAI8YJ48_9PEZI|nr:Uu.00g078180.m01.CDS01 [Anthostomella pinea]